MRAHSFKINLNKASNRLDQFEGVQKRRKLVSLGFFFLLILVGIGFMVYKSYQVHQVIVQQKAELQAIQDKIDKLEASSDFLSPEDIFTLAHVARERLTWADKLAILGDILPRDVAITNLVLDESQKLFTIRGVSKVKADIKDLDLVVSIIDILKSQPEFSSDFSEIKFQSSQRIKHNDQEVVKFEIACLLKS